MYIYIYLGRPGGMRGAFESAGHLSIRRARQNTPKHPVSISKFHCIYLQFTLRRHHLSEVLSKAFDAQDFGLSPASGTPSVVSPGPRAFRRADPVAAGWRS